MEQGKFGPNKELLDKERWRMWKKIYTNGLFQISVSVKESNVPKEYINEPTQTNPHP